MFQSPVRIIQRHRFITFNHTSVRIQIVARNTKIKPWHGISAEPIAVFPQIIIQTVFLQAEIIQSAVNKLPFIDKLRICPIPAGCTGIVNLIKDINNIAYRIIFLNKSIRINFKTVNGKKANHQITQLAQIMVFHTAQKLIRRKTRQHKINHISLPVFACL